MRVEGSLARIVKAERAPAVASVSPTPCRVEVPPQIGAYLIKVEGFKLRVAGLGFRR